VYREKNFYSYKGHLVFFLTGTKQIKHYKDANRKDIQYFGIKIQLLLQKGMNELNFEKITEITICTLNAHADVLYIYRVGW
jgi:hypothetical protein